MQLSEAEWKIMNVLWRAGSASARDVLEALQGETGWAYTTVKTMLTRLVEKGAAREKTVGQAAVYSAKVQQRAAQRAALAALVDRAFGGTMGGFVHHLVANEKLDAKERAALQKLLDEAGGESTKGAAGGDGA